MGPVYRPLHGQAGSRASRWADNPEACGIRVVVGVTLALLFICAVLPLMFPGFSLQQNAQQVESKTLIIPLVTTSSTTTTTTTTATTTTTTTTTTTATTTTTPTTTTATTTTIAVVVASTTVEADETSTATTRTTTTGTDTTATTTSTTKTTTLPSTSTTTLSSTTETTTTATSTTETTTPSAARLARLKCKEEASDPSQLRFPLSFECDEEGSCPSGWTCKGVAAACGAEGSSHPCGERAPSQVAGRQYLSVGGSAHEASLAASPIFMLPDGAHEVVVKFGGAAAGEHAGMSLHMASSGHRICRAELKGGQALRGASLATGHCQGLSLHGGQGVYLLLRTSEKGEQARLHVDDIHILDEGGEDIGSALVIPGVKPKLPNLEGPGSSDIDWIVPPDHCCDGNRPTIATYAGKDKVPYIDGAVMLGLSLQWHVPEFPRICLVIRTMAKEHKDLITAAGWTLIEIDEWHPHEDHFAHDYWWMVYNKIDVFRVKVKMLLWMDSDMYTWEDSLREVLENTPLPKDHIAMVKDCAARNYNSGLMLFKPDLEVYKHLRHSMVTHHGWDGLDQPLINKAYSGRIVELEEKFNTHGIPKTCKGVVVAHYTGRNKPTLANVENLRHVSKGFKDVPYSLRCPHLYEEYFCAMKNARNYLSEELQAALREVGKGDTCLA